MTATWMPMYWGDYIKDTRHLSAAEHGAYLLLIAHYWTTGNPLPDDDVRLSRIVGMTIDEWMAARMAVASFWHIADGVWTHNRIDEEIDRAESKINAKSRAGAIGAEKRWQKHGKGNGKKIADASVCHKQNDAQSPSQVKEPPLVPPTETDIPKKARRRSKIDPDWKPNGTAYEIGSKEGYSRIETEKLGVGFVDYWMGLAKPIGDTDRTFYNHLRSNIAHNNVNAWRRSNGSAAAPVRPLTPEEQAIRNRLAQERGVTA